MKYTRRLAVILSAIILLLGVMVISGSAQRRRHVRRVYYYPPLITRHWGYDPFWSSWGYDPYFYDPYLRERRDRYYKEKSVRDARKKLNKDRAKYQADGVITAKEAEKLMKRRHDLEMATAKLNKYYSENGY